MILRGDDRDILIYHEPEEGVLFWGGPWHNRVVPVDQKEINRRKVLVSNKPRVMSYRREDPIDIFEASTISTVIYKVHGFVSPVYQNNTAEIWYVLIYGDKEEGLLKHLEDTVKSLLWLVRSHSGMG